MNLEGQTFKRNSRNLWASMYGMDLGLGAGGELNMPKEGQWTTPYQQQMMEATGYLYNPAMGTIDPNSPTFDRTRWESANKQALDKLMWDWQATQAGITGMFGGNPTMEREQQQWMQNTQFPEQQRTARETAAWASFGRQFAPNPRWL